MAATTTINIDEVISALRTNPPFDDPYILKKAQPFIGKLVEIVGEYLDEPVSIGRFYAVIAGISRHIMFSAGQRYFGHNGLALEEFHKTVGVCIQSYWNISADVPTHLARLKMTEAQALHEDLHLSRRLLDEAAPGTPTFRRVLLTEPGALLPRPFG